jgi:hypothetical protein
MTPNDDVLVSTIDADALAEQQATVEEQARLAEEADCRKWLKAIKDARDFDKEARKGYAMDRTYCRGQANTDVFDVYVNIAGTYVDILTGFLYARDPDVDVLPAASCGPSRLEQARQLGKTMEIVIASLWKKGKLKLAMDDMVRSGLSVGIGWIKAAWHNRTERDPMIEQQISDLQDNIQRIQRMEVDMAKGDAVDPDALRAEYEQQLLGLESQVETVLSRGMFIDFVRAEDIQVSTEVSSLKHYLNSPWIAHRSFITLEKAKEQFPEAADDLGSASQYFPVKAEDMTSPSSNPLERTSADDAESFRSGTGAVNSTAAHLCVWELWNRESNVIITVAEGLNKYLRAPYTPGEATTRFYPFFQFAPIWVDGQRHPQSLISRSRSLLDEYNRIRTNYREHRKRAIPKMGFDNGAVEPDEAKKMEAGATGEMVGLNLNGQASQSVLFPIQYNQIDAALYDTGVIRAELEMIWGIQEALSSSINVAKTATEAEIASQGTESRLGYIRDGLEGMSSDLAQYTAEVSLQELPGEEAAVMAGPEAYWPQQLGPESLQSLVNVEIRAGSSGKPNTSARMQQWVQMLPQLGEAIPAIGQFLGSQPQEVGRALAELVKETFERTGERIDPERFIPAAPPVQQVAPGTPIDPTQLPPRGVMPEQIPQELPPQLMPAA